MQRWCNALTRCDAGQIPEATNRSTDVKSLRGCSGNRQVRELGTRKGSGAAEAKAKRTQPRPLPLPQAARLALTQYTNTACVSNTILAYLPRVIRNSRSNDLSSLNTKLRLEVGRLYALVPLTYFWKSLLPNSACVQSRRSPLTNSASRPVQYLRV